MTGPLPHGGDARLLWVVIQEVQAEVQQTRLTLRQQHHESRMRREGERLRRLMPDAHPWTIELTAQILVARGLDASGEAEEESAGHSTASARPATASPRLM